MMLFYMLFVPAAVVFWNPIEFVKWKTGTRKVDGEREKNRQKKINKGITTTSLITRKLFNETGYILQQCALANNISHFKMVMESG